MKTKPFLRGIVALLVSAIVMTSLAGVAVTAQESDDVVTSWSLSVDQTCEGFTFSHPPFRSDFGDAAAYIYRITGAGAVEKSPYTANQVIGVTYENPAIVNESEVTIWATYEGLTFEHQIGQMKIFSEPCEVEPPFTGVTAYVPTVVQTCEGFTYSHPEFMHSSMGVAVQYEYQITGAGATDVQLYQPNTAISVTYADTTVSNDSQVSLFATYENGFRHQLGQTRIISEPCDVPEEPGDGEEDPGDGEEDPGNGGEDPGNGGEEPGNGGEDPGNGGEEPGNGGEDPGNGGEEPDTGDEDPVIDEEEPIEGDEDPVIDEHEPDTGDDVPVNGDETAVNGNNDRVAVTELPVVGSGDTAPMIGNMGLLAMVGTLMAGGAFLVRQKQALSSG